MRPASIRRQLALFTLSVVIAAMSLSFAVTYWIPPPEPGRMNIDEMAYALSGERSSVIDVDEAPALPKGLRSALIEDALARALGRPRADVRAVWRDLPGSSAGPGQAVVLINQQDVLVEAAPGGFTMRSGEGAALRTSTFVPLFEAALRVPDGSWRVGVPHDPQLQAWRSRIAFAYAIGVLLLTPLAWAIARRIAKPIARLGQTAGTAAAEAVNPFPVEGPPELRLTALAMNAMHGRLREHGAEQARIFAALAHDLGTPLTALRLRAEALDEPIRTRFVADLDRMMDMASELLDRTSLAAATLRFVAVDLVALTAAWCADRREADEPVVFEGSGVVSVHTDAALLRRAVDNLLDNAIRYGGSADVSLWQENGDAMVVIDDPGPGIAQHLLDEVTKPFVRLEPSRNRARGRGGSGLGLSIAKDIVEMLGGRLTLSNRVGGFRAAVSVPIGAGEEHGDERRAHKRPGG